MYLSRCSPYLNRVEAELKAFIQKNWKEHKDNSMQGFDKFLEWRGREVLQKPILGVIVEEL